MNYSETLDYLFSQLPMYQRVGKAAYKADLNVTIALCQRLDNPEQKFPSVHVAGTNGKGSTCSLTASILQEAGYKVGLFTSPHLKDFRERIRINGELIPQQTVVDFVANHKELLADLSPSFFEWTAALAFHYFAQEEVDIAVMEVGLGGRLDSTNVVNSIVTCITSIGLDHANLLGETLELIAGEKAGIIKAGIPVVIPTNMPGELKTIFKNRASSLNAPLLESRAFLHPAIRGEHQFSNAGCALAMINLLRELDFNISNEEVALGIEGIRENTGLRGRWEVLETLPKIIADVAHNREGIEAMLRLLAMESYEQLHIVFGAVNDKDLETVLPLFPTQAKYYFCKANVPRALASEVLQEKASAFGLTGTSHTAVSEALASAQTKATAQDLILVSGSVFVVAEVV